jgi:hypothetical protein
VVVLFVWIGAVVLAAVVLGFCAYELTWKSKRLQSDLAKLQSVSENLVALRGEVAAVQARAVEVRL